jgi:hypothetical protein
VPEYKRRFFSDEGILDRLMAVTLFKNLLKAISYHLLVQYVFADSFTQDLYPVPSQVQKNRNQGSKMKRYVKN